MQGPIRLEFMIIIIDQILRNKNYGAKILELHGLTRSKWNCAEGTRDLDRQPRVQEQESTHTEGTSSAYRTKLSL
jgi:hypothetical protein